MGIVGNASDGPVELLDSAGVPLDPKTAETTYAMARAAFESMIRSVGTEPVLVSSWASQTRQVQCDWCNAIKAACEVMYKSLR